MGKPKEILIKFLNSTVLPVQNGAMNLGHKISKKTKNLLSNVATGTSIAAGETRRAASQASKTTRRALAQLFHIRIEKGDDERGSTPFQGRLNTMVNSTALDNILQELGFQKYNQANAATFFNEEAGYSRIFRNQPPLYGSLIDFGVPDGSTGTERLRGSLAHKNLVRKYLDRTLNKPLPKDPDLRNKVISFQIFAFANADLLIGKLKYQQERYQGYIQAAVNNSNILPLIMMKELAKISPKDAFPNEDAFNKLIAEAKSKDPKIAEYLKNN